MRGIQIDASNDMLIIGLQLTLEFLPKIRKLFKEEQLSLEHHIGKYASYNNDIALLSPGQTAHDS